ncbi:unnamed protein product [Peniophora sp. CBMAI 1063]|nr:unnamed protein product [Peniophora sp. CBMAI 1063]
MAIQSKHFVNDPDNLVLESLHGLCTLDPALALDEQNRVVYQASQDRSKVALICGGGSGHEPAHAAFVGDGMLTAAVCGSVFASPGSAQVLSAIERTHNDAGTLVIVKNYTGDVLNFGLAKEQFAAAHPDRKDSVRFLVVGDDVAVGRTQGAIVGRRGLAGTVLVYKLAGAYASTGASISEVYDLASSAASRLATVGVGLEHTHVPGTATSSESHLKDSEVEIGMGIHNESGAARLSPVPSLKDLTKRLLDLTLSTSKDDSERGWLGDQLQGSGKDELVLVVNNLGGTSELELGAIVHETTAQLAARGIKVERALKGTYMTSLSMPGYSITLLLLEPKTKDTVLRLLDAPTAAPGWPFSSRAPASTDFTSAPTATSSASASGTSIRAQDPTAFDAAVKRACEAIRAAEPELTRYDTVAGDGDCGLTLKTGAEGVLALQPSKVTGDDVLGSLRAIAGVAAERMGGTSGALYSIFFSALAQGVASSQAKEVTPDVWASALKSALDTLYTYTRARRPSRTLVDPLAAFIEALSSGFDWNTAAKAASNAADDTIKLKAKAGRAAYVGGELDVPDPGAVGVKVLISAILGH